MHKKEAACGAPGGPDPLSNLFGHAVMVNATRRPVRSRYAGNCSKCGYTIPAGFGYVEKTQGRWVVFH